MSFSTWHVLFALYSVQYAVLLSFDVPWHYSGPQYTVHRTERIQHIKAVSYTIIGAASGRHIRAASGRPLSGQQVANLLAQHVAEILGQQVAEILG